MHHFNRAFGVGRGGSISTQGEQCGKRNDNGEAIE